MGTGRAEFLERHYTLAELERRGTCPGESWQCGSGVKQAWCAGARGECRDASELVFSYASPESGARCTAPEPVVMFKMPPNWYASTRVLFDILSL